MAATVVVPIGTPVPVIEHGENGILSPQVDVFMYKSRDCKSAPARPYDRNSSSSSLSSSASSSSIKSNNNNNIPKRLHLSGPKIASISLGKKLFFFIFGHAPEFSNYSNSFKLTSKVKYFSLFFVEAVFRSVGDVNFSSNPFSGLLISIAMFISCPQIALIAFTTLIAGLITAILIHVPLDDIRGGGVLFNNFLTGTVVGMFCREDVLVAFPDILLTSFAIGALTIFIWKGLNGILASRLEFPLLNAPFNVMILLYLFSGMGDRYKEQQPSETLESSNLILRNSTLHLKPTSNLLKDMLNMIENGTNEINFPESLDPPVDPSMNMNMAESQKSLDWVQVFSGILLAPSYVFGTQTIATSLMVYGAILLYSPIMLIQSLAGAAIGTLIGVSLSSPEDYEIIYHGGWAYNPLFTAAGIGGFFLVFNFYSWILSMAGAVITALLYSAMTKLHVPALGLPLMLIIWLLLPSIPLLGPDPEHSIDGPFYRLRLSDLTTPELHRSLLKPKKATTPKKDPTDKYKSEESISPLGSSSVLPL